MLAIKQNTNFQLKQVVPVLCIMLILWAEAAHANSSVGQVMLATGAVSAVDTKGQARVLAKESEVFQGDRISTASKSLCVLKMIDDAKITIRADSEIVIEEYVFKGASEDSSVMELVKGGFRSLTGAIGSNNPDAYKINSDLSVLGIRGTDYDTRICEPGSCTLIGGSGPEYGQYTHVEVGAVFMDASNNGCVSGDVSEGVNGCLMDIIAGQVGFVGLDELKILPAVPGFITNDPTPSPAEISESSAPVGKVESCQL